MKWTFVCLLGIATLAGCAASAPMEYIQDRRGDDVTLVVRNLRYNATDSGYTFSYDPQRPENPCEETRWVYVRKDALVGTRAVQPPCMGTGADFTQIVLRSDWDQAPKPTTRAALDEIPARPVRNPGRNSAGSAGGDWMHHPK